MKSNFKSYNISRVGIIGAAPHRFLDVLSNESVEKFNLYYFSNERSTYQTLVKLVEKYLPERKEKLAGFELPWPDVYNSILNEIVKSKSNGDSVTVSEVFSNFPNVFYKFINERMACTDVLWVGDNDFDSSFVFATFLNALGIRYVLSLKETRFVQSMFEFEALKNAKFVILPHEQYVDFFKKKYSMDLSRKAVFADIDWRSKVAYEALKDANVQKLSARDEKFHVVILSGRVVWNKEEQRSQGRYYYVPIIEDLLNAGFVVHLHTKALLESLDNPVYYEPNPYTRLLLKFPNSFIIEKPLDLNDVENYKLLMRYDLGLLNSGVSGKNEFNEFEKINVPNRFYEYLHANVIPICPRGTLQYMEKKFTSDVLFFENARQLRTLLQSIRPQNCKPRYFFDDFVKTLLDASEQYY